ncbi:DUF4134 domain-containing protein [Paraflavitalea sp. CAU 1676]|uniref:DUF4134 domain-containing protein n=1 Tax=Paraflavitalea sp. CAU 1676 TaxID=3032598 RepID=UPI0023D98FF1|nr:DUF4134 domain-containing protein [Paraflavitalea sp. CAU 1676]MDF2191363.1 DUF4134 domain-containing protein [Paraflavitalea sp. CAU 1676]
MFKKNRKGNACFHRKTFALAVALAFASASFAQQGDGGAGLTKANEMITGYFENGSKLMYAIGAIVGLIGAVKVYQKWSSGDQDTSKVAAAWFSACIFLVVVATVIKSFFGI